MIIIAVPRCSAVWIWGPGSEYLVSNVTYYTNQTLVCDEILINDSYFRINNTGFNITSDNALNITIISFSNDFMGASKNQVVLDFYAYTTSGSVTFRISGMPPQRDYNVKRNGLTIISPVAGADGVITFTNNVWSTRHFVIYDNTGLNENDGGGGGGGGSDSGGDNIVEFYVYNQNNEPVDSSTIYIFDDSVLIDSGVTDYDGYLKTYLDEGVFSVVVQKSGYNDYSDIIVVESDIVVSILLKTGFNFLLYLMIVIVIIIVIILIYFVVYKNNKYEKRA